MLICPRAPSRGTFAHTTARGRITCQADLEQFAHAAEAGLGRREALVFLVEGAWALDPTSIAPYAGILPAVSITTGMRPRAIGELLDGAIKLYVRNARVLMGLAAVVVVPLELLAAIVLISTYNSGNDIPTGGTFSLHPHPVQDPAAVLGAQAILLVTQLLANALITAASVKAVSDAYLDQRTSVSVSLRYGLRRLPALIALQVIEGIGLTLALVALIVPGIFLYIRWGVATPALLIERVGPVRALRRSFRLVSGRWWATAAVLLVATVLVGIVTGVVQAILTGVASLPKNPSVILSVTVATLSTAVGAIISNPFRATVTTILYYDLRIRREGYDLELLADQLGLSPAAVGASDTRGSTSESVGGWSLDPDTLGPESVGQPGGPPFWPPPPGWSPGE